MNKNESEAVSERREFLKRAGKAAVAAPAAALLLNAATVPAHAVPAYTPLTNIP